MLAHAGALLTVRNMHRVGMGSIAEFPGPYPGYTGSVPRSCASLPRILGENGYATGGFGKWHLTPDREQGPAGPFTHWPQGWGFQYFYGFLSGAAGQCLVAGDWTNTHVTRFNGWLNANHPRIAVWLLVAGGCYLTAKSIRAAVT